MINSNTHDHVWQQPCQFHIWIGFQMLAWPFCKLQRVHQLLGKLFPWVIELLKGVVRTWMGSSRTKQMVIWQFVDHPTQRTRYLDLSIVSLRNMKEQCSKICYTWQYHRPVGLYSLWNSLQSIIEVVAILKTLHQDLIGGFQNNDLAEICTKSQNCRILGV